MATPSPTKDRSQSRRLLPQWERPSILKHGRVVFNIGGNKFRLVARIDYPYGVVYIRFVGTHAEYDDIDAETV